MKTITQKIKSYLVAGIFFLMPVIVILILFTKAFGALKSVGSKLSALFGMKTIIGIGSATIVTSLLLILVCIVCGYLVVQFNFMKKINVVVENAMIKYIPGYETYKSMAEEAIHKKGKIIPYSPAFFHTGDNNSKPVFLVEKDGAGKCVIIIPETESSPQGELVIVNENSLTIIENITANAFNEKIKNNGKGLLDLLPAIAAEST